MTTTRELELSKLSRVTTESELSIEELADVPPVLSSTANWSPIPPDQEIGREEALFRRTDHRLPA